MKNLPRLRQAEAVIPGVLKLSFLDGYEGVVDLRPLIAKGKVFGWLQSGDNFARFACDAFGHFLRWTDDQGRDIDMGADNLRRECERQAKVHELMVG